MVRLVMDTPWQLPLWEDFLSQGSVYHPLYHLWLGWHGYWSQVLRNKVVWFRDPYNVEGTQVYLLGRYKRLILPGARLWVSIRVSFWWLDVHFYSRGLSCDTYVFPVATVGPELGSFGPPEASLWE